MVTCEKEHNSATIQAQFRWNSANDVMQFLRLASTYARQQEMPCVQKYTSNELLINFEYTTANMSPLT